MASAIISSSLVLHLYYSMCLHGGGQAGPQNHCCGRNELF